MWLKKSFWNIPDTFDPEDRRRRQIMNVLLIFIILLSLAGNINTLAIQIFERSIDKTPPLSHVWLLIFFGTLWFMNRSRQIPSWFNGTLLIASFIFLLSQMDSPTELYNGRSTIIWAIPVMLGAIIFRPGYTFLITLVICGLMYIFTPPDIRYPNGSINYYVMLTLVFIAFISWLGMSIANRAIRDARHHADEARRHAANLQAILNSIVDGVLVLDLNGNFVSANPALLKMISETDLREMSIKSFNKTMKWKQKIFAITASPVLGVGSVVVFRDETRRHETERAKDALLAIASHELRTPLTVIMNYLELLIMLTETNKINSAQFKEYLRSALESSKRLHNLVRNILDQAQIQAGMLQLKYAKFNLPAMVEKVGQFLEVLRNQKGLSYTFSIAPDVPTEINGDAERLRQVLINLIGNAIKFTSQGSIQVHILLEQKEKIAIEVTDTGPGIPEEQLPDIFEAFRRGSNYAQREQQGAGLGLSIAKEIISNMGGHIAVRSAMGLGSTFTIFLPLKPSQESVPA